MDGGAARARRDAARHPAQRQRQRRPDVRAESSSTASRSTPRTTRRAPPTSRCTRSSQIKGTSETHPDAVAQRRVRRLRAVGLHAVGRLRAADEARAAASRARRCSTACRRSRAGKGNPFKYGFIGDTDTHNAAGQQRGVQLHRQVRLRERPEAPARRPAGPAGGTGPAGARVQLAAASPGCGPRRTPARRSSTRCSARRPSAPPAPMIKVRFFGGWDFAAADVEGRGLRQGRLRARRADGQRPEGRRRQGAELPGHGAEGPEERQPRPRADREGLARRAAASSTRRSTTSPGAATASRTRDRQAAAGRQHGGPRRRPSTPTASAPPNSPTAWTDPEFDPAERAFYYARVLEIPTPRWSTRDAARLGVPIPKGLPVTIQERAWTSPIWYTPAAAAPSG